MKAHFKSMSEKSVLAYVANTIVYTLDSMDPLCVDVSATWANTRAHTLARTRSYAGPQDMPAFDVWFLLHTFGAHMLRSICTPSSSSLLRRTFSQVLLDVVTKFNVIQFGFVC